MVVCLAVGWMGEAARAQEFVTVREQVVSTAPESAQQIAAEKLLFAAYEFRAGSGVTVPYRLLAPEKASSAKVPLVVMLHGSGSIGVDNRSQMDWLAAGWASEGMRQRYPAYVVAPQFAGRSAVYAESKEDGALAAEAGAPLGAVLELIDALMKQYPIDRARIYLVGFSMGASTGWQAMLARPKFFAGAMLLSGVPPKRSLAAQLAGTPVLMAHGNVDAENPFAADRMMFAALQAVPGSKVRFREYDYLGHVKPADVLSVGPEGDWWRRWLFSLRLESAIQRR